MLIADVGRYVSPRTRAQQTLELLRLGCKERYPWQEQESAEQEEEPMRTSANIEVTEDVREWDYGEYEGKTSKEIRTQREQREEAKWDIWSQGCPGGEYVFFFLSFLWVDLGGFEE